ncbi:MAG: sigma-70 family RNA polymerase sigma factor, partial [Acidobacteriota bacterium]
HDASCPRPSPHAAAEASDFGAHLEAALRTLSPTYREIVILREIDGLKYDEIVAVTGRSLATVKVYLHRGRKQLRQALRERSSALDPARPASATPDDGPPSPLPLSRQADPGRPRLRPTVKPEVAHA